MNLFLLCVEICVYQYQTKYAAVSGIIHVAWLCKILQWSYRVSATG